MGRRSKRKDYKKINSPTKSREECDMMEDELFVQQQSDVSGCCSKKVDEESPGEEELLSLSEELRVAEERLKKKEEFTQLQKRKEDVNLALKNLERRKKNKVTATSLREMDSVMHKVDKMMDEKLKFGKKGFSSSSTESDRSDDSGSSTDDSSSDAVDSDDSEEDTEDSSSGDERKRNKKKSSKKKKSEKKKKKTSSRNKKSGKTKKLTSQVKYPQDWPHSFLRLHFVDKNKKYDQLSMSEFCAGYCTIMEGMKGKKLSHRLTHLKDLMYLATRYQWKEVLNFHASCLLEVERGQLKWGETTKFQLLQSTTLAGGISNPNGAHSASSTWLASQSSSVGGFIEGPVLFCKEYQRGICTKTTDHDALDRFGQMRCFRHICAKCWLSARNKLPHPETDESCPSRNL